jgi:hypothetical protein
MVNKYGIYFTIFVLVIFWLYLYNASDTELFDPNDKYALNDAHPIVPNIRLDKSYYNQIDCQVIQQSKKDYTDQYIQLQSPSSDDQIIMVNQLKSDAQILINNIDNTNYKSSKEKIYVYHNDFNLALATALIVLLVGYHYVV